MSTGVIQMMVENFTRESEGTYTVQIHDGKAKTQSSLVLVGDGKPAAATARRVRVGTDADACSLALCVQCSWLL